MLKEQIVMDAHNARTAAKAKAHKDSGLKIEFMLVDLAPGISAYLPKAVTVREPLTFSQHLPTAPSVHPVWETTRDIAGTVAKYGMIAYGIGALSDVWQAGLDSATTQYNGDYQSNNVYYAPEEPTFGPNPPVEPFE